MVPSVILGHDCSRNFQSIGRVYLRMSKRRQNQVGSPELQAALEYLKRSGYAVGSPMTDQNGRTWVLIGGRLLWEEEVLQMSAGQFLPCESPEHNDKEP